VRSRGGDTVLRWIRALVLAAVMSATGVAGHVAAYGVAPSVSLLLPVIVVLTVCAAPFLDQPASARRVTGLLVAGQVVLHVVLQLISGATTVAHAGPAPLPDGMPAGAALSRAMDHGTAVHSTAVHGAALSSIIPPGSHLGMLLAHSAAAVAVGLWLAAGERAAWTLVSVATAPAVSALLTLRDLWKSAAAGPLLTSSPGVLPGWRLPEPAPSTACVGSGVSRRGPPRSCIA
jgi:hypothetical protein